MPAIRALLLILFISPFALAAENEPSTSTSKKQTTTPGMDTVATSSDAIVMNTRLLVRQIAQGDPVRIMTHWRAPKHPFDQGRHGPKVHLANTLAATTFLITTPDGKTHELTAEVIDHSHDYWRGEHPLYWNATHAIHLDKTGFAVTTSRGNLTGKWKQATVPTFIDEGNYTIRLKGKIVGPNATFETGVLKLTVSKDTQPVKRAFDVAYAAIGKHLPEAKLAKTGQTESGFLAGLVYENENDDRVLHFSGDFTKQFWGYDLIQVIVSRKGGLVQVAHRTVNTCVAEGVLIETPRGPTRIESLRVGDEVWSFDLEKREQVRSTISSIRIGNAKELITLGEHLRVTANHPVYTTQGWTRAEKLTASHKLLAFDGSTFQPAAQPALKPLGKAVTVYDLTVDGPHNYFAGGLLVHNKDRAWSPNLDDPWYFYWPAKQGDWKVVYGKDAKE